MTAAKDEKLCDLRAAGLMVNGHDTHRFYCSASTVQKTLKKHALAAVYTLPRRRTVKKPDIRKLITGPNKVYCYDATDFYITSGLKVQVLPILDIGSRKNLKNGVYIRSFNQKNVMDLWDETLFDEGIDTRELRILSDNGGPMKGRLVKAHLREKWHVTLVYARPHTPDDNPWIEAFNKSLKYHPACPETFETVQDVMDWAELHRILHNDHPHSALGYVRPNEEHAGRGDSIRQARKENLALARKERLMYYYDSRAVATEVTISEGLEPIHNSFAAL
ncbi:integrase core domain-containing protein [bacterium]|nr:integrase core domain-containing protein [bacterium]